MQLYEKYRPQQWSEVLGQDKIIAKLQRLEPRGLSGRAYWITGASGTGKTTIGRIIAHKIADPLAIEEFDAGKLSPERLDRIERSSSYRPLGGRGSAIIINEAHGLRGEMLRRLLSALEPIPDYVVWIFTTTIEGAEKLAENQDDLKPLKSRCIQLPLARRDLTKPFAERLRAIAGNEGLDGQPIEKYVKLLQDLNNNFRAAIQFVDEGGMLV